MPRREAQEAHRVVDMLEHVADERELEALAEVALGGGVGAHHVEAARVQLLDEVGEDVDADAALGALRDAAVAPVGQVEVARAVRDNADVEHALAVGERLDELEQIRVGMHAAHCEQVLAHRALGCRVVRIVGEPGPVDRCRHRASGPSVSRRRARD